MTNAQPITHELDGIAFRLAQPANLSFIQQFGRVFHVFDDNDSGNISFGIHDGHQKRFIKLAGGHTINAVTTPEQAVALLRHSEQIYRDLAHPHLVRFRESLEYGDYFGLVFDWTEGGLLRAEWNISTCNDSRLCRWMSDFLRSILSSTSYSTPTLVAMYVWIYMMRALCTISSEGT